MCLQYKHSVHVTLCLKLRIQSAKSGTDINNTNKSFITECYLIILLLTLLLQTQGHIVLARAHHRAYNGVLQINT